MHVRSWHNNSEQRTTKHTYAFVWMSGMKCVISGAYLPNYCLLLLCVIFHDILFMSFLESCRRRFRIFYLKKCITEIINHQWYISGKFDTANVHMQWQTFDSQHHIWHWFECNLWLQLLYSLYFMYEHASWYCTKLAISSNVRQVEHPFG